MEIELKYRAAYFTELLRLASGIPSHDTFSAAFSVMKRPAASCGLLVRGSTGRAS
jgi:hypothetical protein